MEAGPDPSAGPGFELERFRAAFGARPRLDYNGGAGFEATVAMRKRKRKRSGVPQPTRQWSAEEMTRAIAGKLVEARRESGLTQAEVARAVRLSASSVSKVERGERRLDPLELARFARVYGKSIVDFIEVEETAR